MAGRTARARRGLALVGCAGVVLAGCSADGGDAGAPQPAPSSATSSPISPSSPSATSSAGDLSAYTDRGDGCAQAVSAIGYADDALRPLGQERVQEFTDAVRSRLAAVAGTLALEAEDWPSEAVHRQALVLQPLAQAAGAPAPDGDPARARTLLRYRIEAARLVLACLDAG